MVGLLVISVTFSRFTAISPDYYTWLGWRWGKIVITI